MGRHLSSTCKLHKYLLEKHKCRSLSIRKKKTARHNAQAQWREEFKDGQELLLCRGPRCFLKTCVALNALLVQTGAEAWEVHCKDLPQLFWVYTDHRDWRLLIWYRKNSWDSYKFQFSFYAILILTVKFANFKEESGRRLGMFKLAQTPHSMGTIWFFYPRLCEKEKRSVGVYLCNKSLFKGMGGLFDIWRKVFDQGDT